MALRSLLPLSLLALAACGEQPAADPAAAISPTPPSASAASVAPAQSAPQPAQPALSPASTDAAPKADTGERPTLLVTSTSGTVSCDGHNVDLTGDHANLFFKGDCGAISVLGEQAIVQIERAESVRIVGDAAQVTLAGDAKSVELFGRKSTLKAGRVDTLLVPGDNNHVQVHTIGEATLHGRGNRISQQSGTARVDDYGSDNQITTR
ncbi:DUF3060 domain-containing protein [Xanthomonas campestris]|uniref:DUF3060 domain-containing protein n=1 Tax=Xanthomonas campestris TaxID=339 RepID=UPI003557C6B6